MQTRVPRKKPWDPAPRIRQETQRQLVLDSSCLTAPLQAGSPVGEAVYSVIGEELLRVPLGTGAAVPDDRAGERSWLDRLRELVGL